jgi:NAD(P)-dependent dehydrogenase (short-subunit alcohol dehydrogenase family)
LKGIGGSLAIYLARHGAKHLIVTSRGSSGPRDDRTAAILDDLSAIGAQVEFVQADITAKQDVQRIFQATTRPIAGIIQGAMVLRVSFSPLRLRLFSVAHFVSGSNLPVDDCGRIS